jgi:hypothetical protein
MPFPVSPVNGQQATVNGVIYTYVSAIPAWSVTTNAGANVSANNISAVAAITAASVSVTGTITGTLATAAQTNITSVGTLSALTVTATIAGNVNGSAATFTSTSQNSQFNSIGVGTAASTTAGEIRATNNITAFYSSDQRLKTNIKPIVNALGIVSAVGGKTFDWTDDYIISHGGTDDYFMRKSDFGVVAQDIQQVFPQAVRQRPDGTLAVDYEKLVAVAFQAIVELQERVNQLNQGQ